MKSSLTLAAIAVVAASTLSACGGGSGDYCAEVKDLSKDFANPSDLTSADAVKIFDSFGDIAKIAPSEVKDDWKTVDTNLANFQKTLEDLGIDLTNLQAAATADLSDADKTKLQEAYAKLADEKTNDAFNAIEKHALKECDVDLSAN